MIARPERPSLRIGARFIPQDAALTAAVVGISLPVEIEVGESMNANTVVLVWLSLAVPLMESTGTTAETERPGAAEADVVLGAPGETAPGETGALLQDGDGAVDEEVVVLEEFYIDTDSIKPPRLVAKDGVFETMRDLSLQTNLPVAYAEETEFEQSDTYGLAAVVTVQPEHGELTLPDDLETEFIYRPHPGFIGQDEFRYRPFTYHKPLYRATGRLSMFDSDQERVVKIIVNQLPRAVQTQTVRRDLRVERKINILFVIDNSKSMAGEQRILASSFDQFIDGFLQQRLEFRIGVLTTDALNVFVEKKRRRPAVFGAGHLQLTGDMLDRKRRIEANRQSGQPTEGIEYQPFLDNDTPDLTARFEELVQVGTSGHPYETAIVPVLMSYVADLSPGAIEHNTASFGDEPFFYQEDAFLSIVVVSDEDETATRITPIYAEDGSLGEYKVEIGTDYLMKTRGGKQATEQVIERFLTSLKRLKRGSSFRIDAVIRSNRRSAFSRLAELGGGQTADIRKDFSASLMAIGDSIARQASRTFRVPEFRPDEVFFADSIRVMINGRQIPEDPQNGWFFDPDRQTVQLRGQAGEDSFGAIVRIDFDVEYQP